MKITHNKVGQNLNLVDGVKQDKSQATRGARSPAQESAEALGLGQSTRVDVSDRAQEAKRIKDLAMAAPDVDMEKVEKFRKLIDSGAYKVDGKAVADRMVDEHLETEL